MPVDACRCLQILPDAFKCLQMPPQVILKEFGVSHWGHYLLSCLFWQWIIRNPVYFGSGSLAQDRTFSLLSYIMLYDLLISSILVHIIICHPIFSDINSHLWRQIRSHDYHPNSREFVYSRHPDPQRVWKGGSGLRLLTTVSASSASSGSSASLRPEFQIR